MRLFLGSFLVYSLIAVATGDFLNEADSDARVLGAQLALRYPPFLLDPWHKPVLTTLVALALALKTGVVGVKIAQAALAASALVLTRAAALQAGAKDPEALLAAALGGLAPFWVREVASALTEISAALFLAGALLLWLRDRPASSAVLVSFSFLARFEAVFFALAWLPFLAKRKHWLGVALLASGPLAWHLAGWAATGDPKFLLARQPHPWGHSIYGSGAWWTFLALLPVATGALVVPAAMGLRRSPAIVWAVVAAVLAGHTLLWVAGVLGSYGMPRYLVTIVPPLAICAAFGFVRVGRVGRGALFAAALAAAVSAALYRPNSWRGARELGREPNALTDHPTVARFNGGGFRKIDRWRTAPAGTKIAWESSFADHGAFAEIPKERLVFEWGVAMPAEWPWEKTWEGRIYRLK